jgi:hypothetical protein
MHVAGGVSKDESRASPELEDPVVEELFCI